MILQVKRFSALRRIRKGLNSLLKRHRKSACMMAVQFAVFVWYITVHTGNDTASSSRLERELLTRKIADENRNVANDSFAVSNPRYGGVRIIQPKQIDGKQLKITTDDHEANEDSSKCNMETYLIHSQDACSNVLYEIRNTGGSNPSEDEPAFMNDNSCDLDQVELECSTIRKSYLFGKEQITQEEKKFPLAFALKIHGFPNQAHRLLRYIYRDHNLYCVHIDKKAPDTIFQSFKHLKRCFDNVIVVEDRVDVVYSSIRQIEAEMRCLKAAMGSRVKWKYYINLTGQEFLLKTNLEIVRYLVSLNGSNDIESYMVPGDMTHRFKQKSIMVKNQIIVSRTKKAPFAKNIELRKGSAYGMFRREFVNFVLNYPLVKEFIAWLEDTYAPEETIWATLNAVPEAPGGTREPRTYANGLYRSRAVIWSWDRGIRCHGQFVHWICVYGVRDLAWLLASDKMVANKFYDNYEPLALTCLEMAMYKRLLDG